jgi:ubiquinone/menaquinone biosynthesis C-methylase UbiE
VVPVLGKPSTAFSTLNRGIDDGSARVRRDTVDVLDAAIAEYYADGAEERRLFVDGRPRLEYVRTVELLARLLPPAPARVLDVGGGTGVYATALGSRGYTVDLVDPVAHHVDRAREIANECGLTAALRCHLGDARSLDMPDEQYDAVLMLGPLYHLTERADRASAWSEAHRVVTPGGVVIAVGISRFASLLDGLKRHQLSDAVFARVVEEDLRSGQHRNPDRGRPVLFTTAYFHRPEELMTEAADAGLVDVRLFAVEGPAGIVEDIDEIETQVASARAVETEPSLMSASAHILVVARRPRA